MLRKLVGYAAYMFGANTFTALLNFAVSALGMVTRPKEAFGDYAIYMLVYEIGNGIFIFGANATIQRYAADSLENRQRFTKLVFLVFLGMSGVFGLAGFVVWRFIGLNYALALFGLPWVVTYWYGRYVVRSNLDAKREARLMVVASLANTVFQFLFLTLTDLRDALIYGDFLALLASGLMALVTLPAALGLSIRQIFQVPIPREFLKEAFRFTVPLWLAGQVFTLKVRLQSIWTTAFIGSKAMGALQGMQTMWQFAGKPMEYLGQASLPGLVSAKEDRDVLYRELLRFSVVSLTAVAIVVAAGIPFVFQVIDFVAELLGRTGVPMSEKYAEVPVLLLLPTLAVPFTAVEMVTNQYSVAVGKQRTVFYAQVVNVAVMAATLIPLAKHFGLIGVVIAGAIGELGNAGTFIVLLWKHRTDSMRTALVWSVLATAATAAALTPVYVYREIAFSWLLAAPALVIFGALMMLTRMLQVQDFKRVLKAFGRG